MTLVLCAFASLYYEAVFGQFGKANLTGSLRANNRKQQKKSGNMQPDAAARKVSCDRGIAAASRQEYCCQGWFRCKDALERVIPCAQVNDDYCDCGNGSDEPGTSACSARGARFACASDPQNISTAFVDDGFRDCKDGSDEA